MLHHCTPRGCVERFCEEQWLFSSRQDTLESALSLSGARSWECAPSSLMGQTPGVSSWSRMAWPSTLRASTLATLTRSLIGSWLPAARCAWWPCPEHACMQRLQTPGGVSTKPMSFLLHQQCADAGAESAQPHTHCSCLPPACMRMDSLQPHRTSAWPAWQPGKARGQLGNLADRVPGDSSALEPGYDHMQLSTHIWPAGAVLQAR
jgi:hypothetical protein